MPVEELSRIDRQPLTITEADLRKELPSGGPATITGLDVAVLPIRSAPSAATVWMSAAWSGATGSGSGSLVLAGPDADSSGALAVAGDADLWVKVTGAPYIEAIKWGRVGVRNGSPLTLPASVQALIGLDTDGVPFYDPGGIGTPITLSLDTDSVPYFIVA